MDFYDHFKQLASEIEIDEDESVLNFLSDFQNEGMSSNIPYEELDLPFSTEEIYSAIKSLSTNKACSHDYILNEYFTETSEILLEPLKLLFNHILSKQSFPKSWSRGVVIPIYKKGDPDNPSNYQGITLISCFGKLFTTCVNQRLKKWTDEHNILTSAQFGFKSNHS